MEASGGSVRQFVPNTGDTAASPVVSKRNGRVELQSHRRYAIVQGRAARKQLLQLGLDSDISILGNHDTNQVIALALFTASPDTPQL